MEHRIIQYTLEGEFVKVWDNANQAAETKQDSQATIRNSMRGKPSKHHNYIWRYYTPNYPKKIDPAIADTQVPNKKTRRTERMDDIIIETDWKGQTIATYKDSSEAAQITGLSQAYICNVLAGRIKHPKRHFKRA